MHNDTQVKATGAVIGAVDALTAAWLWLAGIAGLTFLMFALSGTDVNDSPPAAAKVLLTIAILGWTAAMVAWFNKTVKKNLTRLVQRHSR